MAMFTLLDESAGTRQLIDAHNRILKRDAGVAGFGTRILWTDFSGKGLNRQTGAIEDNDVPTLWIENGDGEHLLITKNDGADTIFEVQDEGVTMPLVINTVTFDDAVTFHETVTIQDGSGGAVIVFADPANDRLQVGSATPLSNATGSRLEVISGRSYFVAASEETAIGLRNRTSNTGNIYLGASNSNTPDLIVTNTTGTQLARVITTSGLIVGVSTTMSGAELLRVNGGARLEGATTVTTGGLTVTAGGATITAGGLTVSASGAAITGASSFSTTVTLTAGPLVIGSSVATTGSIRGANNHSMYARNNANSQDLRMIESNNSDDLYIGTSNQTNAINMFANGSISIGIGASTKIVMTSTGVSFNGASAVAPPNFTITNATADRLTLDQTSGTATEVREVLGTVVKYMILNGLFS